MGNIRSLVGLDAPYHTFNREERNLAALLYHALLLPGNLRRFLAAIDCPFEMQGEHAPVYFEYALLRDLWKAELTKDPAKARRVILACLNPPAGLGLEGKSVEEFNAFFGAGNEPSKKYIQSPATWSMGRFMKNIDDDAFFLAVCRFKWCFNAKPDVVIQVSPGEVLCIEAKLESGEGAYPSSAAEKAEFKRRELEPVRQTELQKHMFEQLLGMQTQLVFLVAGAKKGESKTHARLTWREAFDALDVSGTPEWVQEWAGRV